MKYLNHPILGDTVYGTSNEAIKRQMLHAYRLKFIHPVTKKEMEITAEIPEDFKKAAKFAGVDINKIKF